ncbi:MAG TPA: hypothetical protein VFX59_13970 [Polyangiales bacterium]|nr:hypothetical protein [Polyangiales bacterium]
MRIVFFCAALALGACGDDSSESGDIPEPRHFSELTLPFNDAPACIATNSKKHQDDSSLTGCRCNACLELMQECEAVQGCQEIVACSNRTGCLDEFSCYLFPGAQCASIIDRWGNSSIATAISLEIMACTTTHNCR